MSAQLLDLEEYRRKHSGSSALRKAFMAMVEQGDKPRKEESFEQEYFNLRATIKEYLLLEDQAGRGHLTDNGKAMLRNLRTALQMQSGAKYEEQH